MTPHPRASEPERFSIAWRVILDGEYQRGDLSEQRWRELIAVWEIMEANADLLAALKEGVATIEQTCGGEYHNVNKYVEKARALLAELEK
jgi:hypothetical protein